MIKARPCLAGQTASTALLGNAELARCDRLLRRSFHAAGRAAAFLVRAGLSLSPGPDPRLGFRPVWHGRVMARYDRCRRGEPVWTKLGAPPRLGRHRRQPAVSAVVHGSSCVPPLLYVLLYEVDAQRQSAGHDSVFFEESSSIRLIPHTSVDPVRRYCGGPSMR